MLSTFGYSLRQLERGIGDGVEPHYRQEYRCCKPRTANRHLASGSMSLKTHGFSVGYSWNACAGSWNAKPALLVSLTDSCNCIRGLSIPQAIYVALPLVAWRLSALLRRAHGLHN